MSGEHPTHREMAEALEDDRMEQGIIHQTMREDWRSELKLELRSFKNEIRVLLVVTVLLLKFNLPNELTAGAIAVVSLKAAIGFFRP